MNPCQYEQSFPSISLLIGYSREYVQTIHFSPAEVDRPVWHRADDDRTRTVELLNQQASSTMKSFKT